MIFLVPSEVLIRRDAKASAKVIFITRTWRREHKFVDAWVPFFGPKEKAWGWRMKAAKEWQEALADKMRRDKVEARGYRRKKEWKKVITCSVLRDTKNGGRWAAKRGLNALTKNTKGCSGKVRVKLRVQTNRWIVTFTSRRILFKVWASNRGHWLLRAPSFWIFEGSWKG